MLNRLSIGGFTLPTYATRTEIFKPVALTISHNLSLPSITITLIKIESLISSTEHDKKSDILAL